jgi:catalase
MPKQEMNQHMEQKLSHQLSMQIMEMGQTILELEANYRQSMSRRMYERLRRAKEILDELAQDCMTEITAARMKDWEAEREKEKIKFNRPKEAWEVMTPEQKEKIRKDISRKCAQGFGGGQV